VGPRALGTAKGHWPAPASTFVGRADELAALGRLLEGHRLVTVLGAPGIGKTRLALEWLHKSKAGELWPGGARFCDLSDASTADDVVRFFAKVLGVSLAGTAEASVPQLGAALASRPRTLVVLDNLEHLLDVTHPMLTAWLGEAPSAHFLVTSRERLKLDGEHVLELGPLPSSDERDDAVHLFVERARQIRAGYSVTPDERGILRELVGELDGNPLAIELAAARIRVLSPKEILARMPERFEVLVSERRGQPRRSALLEAIEESWILLSDAEREALADCAVFRGGFDLRAAEEVLTRGPNGAPPAADAPSLPAPVVDLLESLCDKSLVAIQRSGAGAPVRFVLLASIRAYALQHLDESQRTAALDRHARYCAKASAVWNVAVLGRDAPTALDELRADAENLTAAVGHLVAGPPEKGAADRALSIALALSVIFGADGPFALRASLLKEAISFADRSEGVDPELLAYALDASVLALVAVGEPVASRANAERSCALAETLGESFRGRAKSTLGLSFAMEGRVEDAARCLGESLAELRSAGDRLWEGRVLGRFAWLDWMTGKLESARDRFRLALELHRSTGDRVFEAMNGGYLAIVAHELGELVGPRRLLEHAIAEQQRLGHRRIEADLTAALGSLCHELGELDRARELQRDAFEIYRAVGHSRDQASLLCDIARVALDDGRVEDARAAFLEALPVARATENALTVAEAEAGLGAVAAGEGDLDEARACFERARASASPGSRWAAQVELLAMHLEIAEARAAFLEGDDAASKARLDRVCEVLREATVGASGGRIPFRERRIAVAALERAVRQASTWSRRAATSGPATAPGIGATDASGAEGARVLAVCRAKRTVRTPDGRTVALERHPALWRLTECFADARVCTPERALGVDELVAAGWPGERVRSDAGARRVYTALSTLRREGLRDVIVKRDQGYCFDPDVQVVFDTTTT
jgi:predicted ATPase